MYQFCQLYTGGSIDGAHKLNHGVADIARAASSAASSTAALYILPYIQCPVYSALFIVQYITIAAWAPAAQRPYI